MRFTRTKQSKEGFILVVVLCMVIMLTVLLVGFNNKSRSNLFAADDFRKSSEALNCARAGLNIAIAAVRAGDDTLPNKTLLNLLSGENTFAVGAGECSITVTKENGKLNVNLLRDKNGRVNRTRTEQLLRLIGLLNGSSTGDSYIGCGIVPAIIDWTDSDEQVTRLGFARNENSGAESGYYGRLKMPYRCKNAPLGTSGELLLVRGITPQVFESIGDYVTVYGDGEIDINFAARGVIESLSEKMDVALAQVIIDRRKIKLFESVMELRDVPGMTEGIYNEIKHSVTVRPAEPFYYVTSRANADSITRAVAAILKKNPETKNVDVILYKEL